MQPSRVVVKSRIQEKDRRRNVFRQEEFMTNRHVVVREVIERIKGLRSLEEDSQVAEILGTDPNKLSKWKQRGTFPKNGIALLLTFAERENISLEWLLQGKQVEAAPKTFTVQCGPEQVAFTPVRKITALVSGGYGEFVYDEECNEIYSFRADWLSKKGTVAQMRLAEVTGDSMLPTLSNGDFVLFDISKREPRDGKIMVVGVGDSLLIKRIRIAPEGIYLLSDNRSVYEPMLAKPENTRFLGLVIWCCGDL